MEHYAIRPKWLTDWRVKDLGAFGLSDPSWWGARRQERGRQDARRAAGAMWRTRAVRAHRDPGAEAAFSFLAVALFVLWWVGLVHFPGLS